MKPAPFRYHAPETMEEALHLLAHHGSDARPLAGGQSLVPAMNFRLARPTVLIDLNRVAGLGFIRRGVDGALRLGAMTRQREAERSNVVAAACPLLAAALPWVGHAQIRNRGTVGGSLAQADPAAEIPAVALACGATLRLCSRRGERRVAAEEFVLGPMTTALQPDELLAEIEIPATPAGTGVAFEEMSRRHADFALAGAAACLRRGSDGTVEDLRLVLFGVGGRPLLARRAAQRLAGALPDARAIDEAVELQLSDLQPQGDLHASSAYRRHVVGVLARRVLIHATERAGVRP